MMTPDDFLDTSGLTDNEQPTDGTEDTEAAGAFAGHGQQEGTS